METKRKSSSYEHAKRELEILAKTVPDAIILPFSTEILELCEVFGNSGQSGGSAPYVSAAISQALKSLMMFKTLAPLTGDQYEWNGVGEDENGEITFQNNRDSRVFKNGINGRAYFIDAIVFNGSIGGTFTGGGVVVASGDSIGSKQYIKSFPFEPKTFYIDVIDYRFKDKDEKTPDENGDWWKHEIKDEKQLDAVFEYYDKLTI
jgi:hypothetical protein